MSATLVVRGNKITVTPTTIQRDLHARLHEIMGEKLGDNVAEVRVAQV